ncbi:hypothetical protein Leryth_006271 [Lithospermum erythrorhizon]|nr:hypothetical protein Leryth_006271 [Lithospermum erythrorhizon]
MQKGEESSYSSTIIKVAMSQICQSIGFEAAESSSLNTITDIAIRYLKAIAKSASSSANSLNRTQCNVFDIVVALEELGSVVGFQGGSDMRVECVLSSSVLVDLERFVIFSNEIPFAKALGRRRRGEDGAVNGVLKDGVKDIYVPFSKALGRRGCGDCVGLICGKKDGVVDVKANDVPLVKVLGGGRFGGGGDCAGLVCGKKCGVVDDEGDGVVKAKALARRRVCGVGDCDCVGLVCLKKGGGVVDDVVKVKHVPRWLPEMPVICMEEEGEEEGRWEEGWKCCGNKEREEMEEKENMRFELSGKRGEVKERVRKGTRGGVSRSGGCGKRVLCRNDWKGGHGGVEKKWVMVSFKKRLK